LLGRPDAKTWGGKTFTGLCEGNDHKSRHRVRCSAQTVIYPIHFAGPLVLPAASRADSRRKARPRQAEITLNGGRNRRELFEVEKDHPVEEACAQTERALRDRQPWIRSGSKKDPAAGIAKSNSCSTRPGAALQPRKPSLLK
jgi:hypothetical protein